MNAERLHRILLEVKSDYETKGLLEKIRTVRDNLQNQVNQPQQPVHQENLVASLNTLYDALSSSPYNDFSTGWKQIIAEIGGDGIFGTVLKEKIVTIFSYNQITPAAALQHIITIVTKLETFKTSIDSLITGFNNLNIGAEELEAGECELVYTIPRLFIQNKLNSLNKEITELNFILNNISEVVTGEKKEFEVKTISSSDFSIYVLVSIYVAKVISEVVEKLIENYKKILEIKKLRNELRTIGMPDKETKSIEQYANSLMQVEIEKIVKQVMNSYAKKDDGRKNELSNGIAIALNKIANRIDNGFNIEIRVKELSPIKEEEATPESTEVAEMINIIKSNAKIMEYIKTDGQPILQLSEGDEEKKAAK